jgi:hypothetical protein
VGVGVAKTYQIETLSGREWSALSSVHNLDVAKQFGELAMRTKADTGAWSFDGVRIKQGALVVFERKRAANSGGTC